MTPHRLLLAFGAAALATVLSPAANAKAVSRTDCYIERVRIWRPRRNADVVSTQRYCY